MHIYGAAAARFCIVPVLFVADILYRTAERQGRGLGDTDVIGVSLHHPSALSGYLLAGLVPVLRRVLWTSQLTWLSAPLDVRSVSALTVQAVSPNVSFARRMSVILVALLLVLSAARSGERKEIKVLVYGPLRCTPGGPATLYAKIG